VENSILRSKENFPEGAGALHLPWSSGDAGLSARQKRISDAGLSAGQIKKHRDVFTFRYLMDLFFNLV
jgi:hypothetical protein